MRHRRFLTALLLMAWLGVASSGSGGLPSADLVSGSGADGVQTGRPGERSDLTLVSTRVRGLGFDIGPISREAGLFRVPVTGFRAVEKVFQLQGPFRPFTLRARVDKRRVVLSKEDLEGAGIIIIDSRALQDRGIRIEAIGPSGPGALEVRPTTKTRPPAAAIPGKDLTQAPVVAGPRKLGPVRWSSTAMMPPKPGRTVPPPRLGTAVNIKPAERRIEFKSSLFKVNKRTPLAYSAIPVLDPEKKDPTPLADPQQVLPTLPNGQVLTAEDYYRELNLLEKDFNALGYSLDTKRDAAEDTLLQEILPPSGMNGTGVKPDFATLERVRSRQEGFRSALSAKQAKFAGIVKPKMKSAGQPSVGAVEKREARPGQQAMRAQLQKAGPPSLEDSLREAKKALKPPPNPYKRELNPVIVEKGDRDTFAIVLDAGSRQEGSHEALGVVNDIGVKAYIFGNGLDFLRVMGTTYAPTAGGAMSAELSFMVLGNAIPGAGFSDSSPVPAAGLAESAALPPVGREEDWSTSLDVGFGMSFMAGPVPLSVRVGARATLGLEYTLLASPLRVENEIRPYANADVYAQGGVNLLIVEAGVGCNLTLIDTWLAVHGMLQRGAEEGREFLDIEYFIHRYYEALSGDLNVYAYVYVPAWRLPPWKRKKYTSQICDWKGWSDDLWEPAMTRRKHNLFIYSARDAIVAGYNY